MRLVLCKFVDKSNSFTNLLAGSVSAILRRPIQFKGRHKLFSVSETQLMYNRSNLSFFKPNFNGKYFYELAILSDVVLAIELLNLFGLLLRAGIIRYDICCFC